MERAFQQSEEACLDDLAAVAVASQQRQHSSVPVDVKKGFDVTKRGLVRGRTTVLCLTLYTHECYYATANALLMKSS